MVSNLYISRGLVQLPGQHDLKERSSDRRLLTFVAPATEVPVEIKPSSPRAALAIASLEIPQPITCDINASRNDANCNSRGDQYNPDISCIDKLANISCNTVSARIQHSLPLSFFRVFEDPIDRREIIVPYSSPWPFNVPIE